MSLEAGPAVRVLVTAQGDISQAWSRRIRFGACARWRSWRAPGHELAAEVIHQWTRRRRPHADGGRQPPSVSFGVTNARRLHRDPRVDVGAAEAGQAARRPAEACPVPATILARRRLHPPYFLRAYPLAAERDFPECRRLPFAALVRRLADAAATEALVGLVQLPAYVDHARGLPQRLGCAAGQARMFLCFALRSGCAMHQGRATSGA